MLGGRFWGGEGSSPLPRLNLTEVYLRVYLTEVYLSVYLTVQYPKVYMCEIYPEVYTCETYPRVYLGEVGSPKFWDTPYTYRRIDKDLLVSLFLISSLIYRS